MSIGRLSSYDRDDLMHVAISPHLPENVFQKTSVKGRIRELVIASRSEGYSFFPLVEFPMPVYILVILNDAFRTTGCAGDNDLVLADWGVIAADLASAQRAMYPG